jgi:hypothetical protein
LIAAVIDAPIAQQPEPPIGPQLDGDEVLTVSQLRNLPKLRNLGRGGARPDVRVIVRLMTAGKVGASGRRIVLEHQRSGSRYLSTARAVDRFFARLAEGEPAPIEEHDLAHQAHVRADVRLAAMGI